MKFLLLVCVLGAWQWPYRGVLVGEASHPGPILVDGDHIPETAVGSDMDETQETAGGATTAALLSMEVDDLFGDLLAPPAIDLDAAVPSIPVPPPPPPDVLGNGRVLRCPFCPRYSTQGQARGTTPICSRALVRAVTTRRQTPPAAISLLLCLKHRTGTRQFRRQRRSLLFGRS